LRMHNDPFSMAGPRCMRTWPHVELRMKEE
jgi:hypothetical protein